MFIPRGHMFIPRDHIHEIINMAGIGKDIWPEGMRYFFFDIFFHKIHCKIALHQKIILSVCNNQGKSSVSVSVSLVAKLRGPDITATGGCAL